MLNRWTTYYEVGDITVDQHREAAAPQNVPFRIPSGYIDADESGASSIQKHHLIAHTSHMRLPIVSNHPVFVNLQFSFYSPKF